MLRDKLRRELLAWIADDDATRERLARAGSLWAEYHPEMESVHRKNADRLAEVVAAHGWPGRGLVGADGAAAAFRIAQHAIGEPARMRAWLVLLTEAAARGEADRRDAAMMEDRIRVFESQPQRYGTQLDWNEAGDAIVPMGTVEAPETIDERRREVGLPPLEWLRPPPPGETPPLDIAAHRRELDSWARRTG